MCPSSASADLRENNRRPHKISSVLLSIYISTITVRFLNVVIDFWTDVVLCVRDVYFNCLKHAIFYF